MMFSKGNTLMIKKIIDFKFFNRPVTQVAQDLIGKYLVRNLGKGFIALQIMDVEAYDGTNDLACHGHFGKTSRTEVMFLPAGRYYVYLIYGMYWMLNVVVDKQDYPAAVLVRGAGHLIGPGKLTRKLGIDKSFNGKLIQPDSGLWIEDRFSKVLLKDVVKLPRVGVGYASPEWAEKPYRYLLRSSEKHNVGGQNKFRRAKEKNAGNQ